MAGYSGTPLPKKLGIKEDCRVLLVNPPANFAATLGDLPAGVDVHVNHRSGPAFDVILFFTESLAQLRVQFPKLSRRLVPNGGLWVAWPKRGSGVATDLSEDLVREVGLNAGLVDNKVCAVDVTWSGLRFVIRLKDRPRKPA